MSWIDALKAYNAGMPSWCIPRKGTAAYDTIVKLRKGEKTETPKEIIDKLERKTQGRPKKQKRIVRIQLDKVVPKMTDTQEVEIPVVEDKRTRAEFQEPAAKMKKKAPEPAKKGMKHLLVSLFNQHGGNAMDIWEERDGEAVEIARVLPTDEGKYYFYPVERPSTRKIIPKGGEYTDKHYRTKETKAIVDLFEFSEDYVVSRRSHMLPTAIKGLEKMGYALDFEVKPIEMTPENVKDPRIASLLRQEKRKEELEKEKKEKEDKKKKKEEDPRTALRNERKKVVESMKSLKVVVDTAPKGSEKSKTASKEYAELMDKMTKLDSDIDKLTKQMKKK